MSLQIYNTLTRRKERFEPHQPRLVKMYVCGPTVYDSTHIGHAMSYLTFDVIRRYLEFKGYQVRYVQNFTDIDDKIIQRAAQLGVSPEELADRYAREYLAVMADLNIKEADIYPRASAEVPMIIQVIEDLIRQGNAYVTNGNVYFNVMTFPQYGQLSRRPLAEMQAGESVEACELKTNPADFALWKAAKPGEPSWSSPWGPGRPGWHIECSAMSYHHLGEQIDIHGGGTDLIFPHHENEIAQSEAFTGKQPFVRYWLHNGLLQLGEQKMSKSLGNLITVKDFLKQHEADAFRLFILSSNYRHPITYTDEAVGAAEKGLERLRSALRPAHDTPSTSTPCPEVTREEAGASKLAGDAARTYDAFVAAMDDDFNTAQAIAALFELVTSINRARDEGIGGPDFEVAQGTLRELTSVLGLHLDAPNKTDLLAKPFIDLLIQIRSELRTARQWALADRIRTGLSEQGIILEDGPNGTTWRAKSHMPGV